MGPICSTCVHSEIHLHYMFKIYSQSVQSFDHISHFFLIVDPLNPPKCRRGVSWGELYLAYVHSQTNPQTCTKCGANRSSRLTASQDLNVWPPKTPKCPLVSRGAICLSYINSQMNMHVCQIWCQSVQPFGSFSRICAKVSSALSRCACCLAQKHAKKQHLYIENYNSGPNMPTTTPLTFFTAIFLAFSGSLAKELMILCWHVTTELYL